MFFIFITPPRCSNHSLLLSVFYWRGQWLWIKMCTTLINRLIHACTFGSLKIVNTTCCTVKFINIAMWLRWKIRNPHKWTQNWHQRCNTNKRRYLLFSPFIIGTRVALNWHKCCWPRWIASVAVILLAIKMKNKEKENKQMVHKHHRVCRYI